MTNKPQDPFYKGVTVLLFSFLFLYILLRALLVDTLHDEVATYMFYFYQGDYLGATIQWDANNHLLNSFIGHLLYKVFGDNFFVLRLPNVLAFVLYFWATVRLAKDLSAPWLKTMVLLALNTVPFVMEYFGNARGYGLSLGFFAWALVHGLDHLRVYSLRSLYLSYAFLLLAIAANLTLINSSAMLALIFLCYPLLNRQSKRVAWKEMFVHFGFALALAPFVYYGVSLKRAGALYYGSLDGLWDVTGKSLSRYVLFYDADLLMYFWLLLFALLLLGGIVLLRSRSFSNWLREPALVFAALFFGNLIMAVGMAKILEINYPEDRTAIYLIPVFILLVAHLLEHFKKIQALKWLFLFFPLTFIWHFSFSTSVFSPDDRLDSDFYATVKKEIQPENSVMIYHILNWNWPYHESHERNKASVALFDNPNSILADIIVTKTTILNNPDILRLYDTIAYHPASTYIAFKRKVPMLRMPLDTTEKIAAKGNLEYADICQIPLDGRAGKDLLLSVSGHLKTQAAHNKIQLVVQTFNAEGAMVRNYYYSFETTYQSQLIDDNFLHHFIVEQVSPDEKQIKVYLWNRALHLIDLKESRCVVYELKSPENGTR